MIKKLMAAASLTAVLAASSLVVPTVATAKSPATDYAVAQCGNGGWAQKQYPSYDDCYMFAVQYYFQQTGGGGGGGGGAGGGGGSALPGLPTWHGCEGTRLPCNNGN